MESKIDARAICRIIKECSRSQVSRLEIGDLTIEFGSDRKLELPKAEQHQLPWVRQPETTTEIESPKVLLTPEDREAFRAMEEFQLAIDDPVAFENMQISEDVENVRVRELHAEVTEDRGSEQDLHRGR